MNQPFNAKQYKEHAARKRQALPTEMVTLQSGAVFELRRPSLSAWMMTGRLPQSLLNVGMKQWKEQGKTIASDGDGLAPDDAIDALVFMREVVHDCTVSPKFVQFATSDNEIGADDMLPADFSEIFQWAMKGQGVIGSDSLRQFRGGQERGVAAVGTDGTELWNKAVEVAALEQDVQ